MKRQPSRAPSPTPTSFSGISNYRTEQYRPIREKNVPSVPNVDYRQISKRHFEELSQYLAAYLARAAPNSRSTARQKLTRLTVQQFHELSTDVYDELVRRKDENEVPFLPVRSEFHPKRNQARQKLATLPTSRFEDLSSDVYYELARRYPEFKEDPSGRASVGSNYDDYPPQTYPTSNSPPRATGRTSGRTSAGEVPDSGYGGSISSDRRRPSDAEPVPQRNEDKHGSRQIEDTQSSRRRPSQDTTRKSDERGREYGRRPSAASGTSDSTATAQATTATSGMIIPNKSTMEEEYIEVPYGREVRDSNGTMGDDRNERGPSRDVGTSGNVSDNELDSASEYPSPSPRSPPGGLNGLSARLKSMSDEDDDRRVNDEYYEKMSYGRTSTNSERMGTANSRTTARMSNNEVQEKMKQDYEMKIARMQSQIISLQKDANENKSKGDESVGRRLEGELDNMRRRFEEQTTSMRDLQKELEEIQETRQREKEREVRRARDDDEELQILRDRIERLEGEQAGGGGGDPALVEQLHIELSSLAQELNELSKRNDELMTAKEADAIIIRDMGIQLKEYKRKYEQAKTELRHFKATSQLFVQQPRFEQLEDRLPYLPNGGIVDIHVTAFLSAIDTLLTAGRQSSPTRVLGPMRIVVNAVSAVIDDVIAFERRPPKERGELDFDRIRALRERLDTTLSNLATASKTHASAAGLSPVSLLDAAASHVSSTMTDLCRTVSLRKATKAEQEQFQAAQYSPGATATNGYTPSLSSVGEGRTTHQRNGSAASTSSRGRYSGVSPTSPPPSRGYPGPQSPSTTSSSSNTNPSPIFSGRQGGSMDMTSNTPTDNQEEQVEDTWAEIRPYLEAQTESIVQSIQHVLSSVRNPTPSPTTNEYVTQIITIVTSIVAVCKGNFPVESAQRGNELLTELSDHVNQLSEVQAQPEVTKESRQAMAKSSFTIATVMKELTKL